MYNFHDVFGNLFIQIVLEMLSLKMFLEESSIPKNIISDVSTLHVIFNIFKSVSKICQIPNFSF